MDKIIKIDAVERRIVRLRGQDVILASEVARLYGVETREINQAIKNNPDKFPEGYVFELTKDEKEEVIKKFDDPKLKYSPSLPKAFTEKGLYMLATILKGERAVQTTLAIIETFAAVRELRRDLIDLHKDAAPEVQKSKMERFGNLLSDIVMPDLQTEETESTLELNFVIGKIKHTVKRTRKDNNHE